MAIQRLKIDGYGQIELNKAPFRRSGRIEAQCKLVADDYVENGMVLAVDRANHETYTEEYKENVVYALNYTTEHMYDEREGGLKHFKLDKDTFCPRLGFVGLGDSWTTNCLAYDTAEFANDDTFKTTVEAGMYAIPSITGALCVKKGETKPEGAYARVVKVTTMPDGQFALQFDAI